MPCLISAAVRARIRARACMCLCIYAYHCPPTSIYARVCAPVGERRNMWRVCARGEPDRGKRLYLAGFALYGYQTIVHGPCERTTRLPSYTLRDFRGRVTYRRFTSYLSFATGMSRPRFGDPLRTELLRCFATPSRMRRCKC